MKNIEIKVPILGESVVEATVGRWLKKSGELLSADSVMLELETDKVTLEIYAPCDGVISDILVNSGSTVKVGTVLAIFKEQKIEKLSINVKTEEQKKIDPNIVSDVGLSHKKEINNILNPNHGQSNVHEFLAAAHLQTFNSVNATKSVERSEIRGPMSKIRKRIAERLKQSQNTAAILTTFNEVDMSSVMDLRTRYKDVFEKKHGIKLGLMSFFVKACVQGLKEHPIINSCIEGNDIITKSYNDIGVAVATPSGLLVPVVRNADSLTFAEIEKNISDLGKKARDGKITLDELSGGTFTITNGGVFGSLLSTPILNLPQSAILGMHKIQDRPVVVNGQIVVRPMMYLALSYDHRLVDGKDAVTFLVTIKECLENSGRFLLGI